MISLLDVNVLVALFDPAHVHHDVAHAWFDTHRREGWATCPLTENGFVRVVSNPAYPGALTTVRDAIERMRRFVDAEEHTFWPATSSITDRELLSPTHVGGHRQITDVYLLALGVLNGGRLATFDAAIPVDAVHGAASRNLIVVGQ